MDLISKLFTKFIDIPDVLTYSKFLSISPSNTAASDESLNIVPKKAVRNKNLKTRSVLRSKTGASDGTLLETSYLKSLQSEPIMPGSHYSSPVIQRQRIVHSSMIPVQVYNIPVDKNASGTEQISKLRPSQSPIAISLQRCPTWSSLDPLKFKGYWDNKAKGMLLNTGQTAYFTFDTNTRPRLSGGPLIGEYVFEQMHFHWSVDDYTGCEHVLDGQGYAAECHFVHYNSKYPSLEAAVGHPDGLAVVGFLLEAVDAPNPRFDRLVEGIEAIKKRDQSVDVTSESLSWMARDDLEDGSYVTYKGSLTTPPFTECVTWIIYEKPVQIGMEQLGLLRQLEDHNDVPIERNVRPTQRHPPGHSVIYVTQVKAKL